MCVEEGGLLAGVNTAALLVVSEFPNSTSSAESDNLRA